MRALFGVLLCAAACCAACGGPSDAASQASDATPESSSLSPDPNGSDGGVHGAASDGGDAALGATADAAVDAHAMDAGAPPDLGPAGDFRSYAEHAAAALQGQYDAQTGLFPSTGWWNSANAITALVDTMRRTGSTTYESDLATTFSKNSSANFLNQYYDDEGWWALAWIDAYDLTKDASYLSMAKTIFADMKGGWDGTCGGGIWWSKARTYKNAIANELFLQVAIRLHERTPGDSGAGSFLDWATREWTWFDASGMINAQSLVNDGLASCKNNGGATWTYNQGVLIGALVDLAKVQNDPSLLTRAEAIADATTKKLVDDVGVLHEPCEPSCGGDGTQFKGIFMRHLAELDAATSESRYRVFITVNADWIWNAARTSSNDLGLSWSQATDAVDASRQSSALDALNAAIPYAAPATNLALHKTATANGACASGQGAAQAVDGLTSTKWCAGASNGAYWLEVDLGAATEVGRIIVRHSGAGGESAGWNTRDFTLNVSTNGTSWQPVAAVKGNTRSVTIHGFAPVTTRYVRLEITSPQTDPQYPAARIYELETYAR
jgi:predicted alpha-1,6-mannanase (GH76 family)